MPQLLGPVSTRNLLVCVLWVLKSVDRDLLSMWWNSLSISRLSQLIAVTDLCVSCFEYKVRDVIIILLLLFCDQGRRKMVWIRGPHGSRARPHP